MAAGTDRRLRLGATVPESDQSYTDPSLLSSHTDCIHQRPESTDTGRTCLSSYSSKQPLSN